MIDKVSTMTLFDSFFTWGILVRKNAVSRKSLLCLATLPLLQAAYRLKVSKTVSSITLIILVTFIGPASFAQNGSDSTDGRFHDALLDHLVGKWTVSGIAHGVEFNKLNLEAAWVMSHQYLRIDEKSEEIVPWLGIQFERVFFIGYNHTSNRYVVHDMNVFGAEEPYEGFCYAYRSGNEIKLVQKSTYASDSINIQRLTWEPASGSWHIEARWMISGKEGEPFLVQKAVAAKPSSTRKKSLSK